MFEQMRRHSIPIQTASGHSFILYHFPFVCWREDGVFSFCYVFCLYLHIVFDFDRLQLLPQGVYDHLC